MADSSASSEPVSGVLVRFHPDGIAEYDAACVVVADDGDPATAVVKGMVYGGGDRRRAMAIGRALDDELRRLGYRRFRYERRRSGESYWVERQL